MGRISFLVDENTQALHFFITAMLQLFDRAGTLYGELARFVLRILGIRSRKRGGPGKAGEPPAADAEAAWGQAGGPNGPPQQLGMGPVGYGAGSYNGMGGMGMGMNGGMGMMGGGMMGMMPRSPYGM